MKALNRTKLFVFAENFLATDILRTYRKAIIAILPFFPQPSHDNEQKVTLK